MQTITDKLLTDVAAQFGTPTFLYDMKSIEEKYLKLRDLLDNACTIFYSMKANPALAICEYLRIVGSCCEVSSRYELLIALKAGFLPEQIIFVGPGKNNNEIEYAVKNKIKSIVCESLEEINHVNLIAEKHQTKTSIMIRINPPFFVSNAPIKMSGIASQFGIDINQFSFFLDKISQYRFVSIDGIQIYNASRVLDKAAIVDNIKKILTLADTLSKQYSIEWKTIDIGGGFGIPYFANEKALDICTLISDINFLFQHYKSKHPKTKFILELGRYLVAESGYLISTVQSVKKNHDKNYIVVDAGFNCYMAAAGLGSFIHRNFPMRFIALRNDENSIEKRLYQVSGPLCTPGDILLKDIHLPVVHPKDLIILLFVGAYGLSASPGKFLSHGFPEEVIFYKNNLQRIRRRETIDDFLATQFQLN